MQDIRQETLNECTRAEQSASVVLWEIDLTEVGGERYFFCNEQNEKGEPVTWQGRQYQPYPIQGSGFELNGKGTSTRPTLTVSNLYGMVTGMAEDLQSLVGGTVVRRKVYARFLDAVNFVNGNSGADPEQEVISRWRIEQCSELSAVSASFVLSTPTETDGAVFPGRIMLANTCTWTYRGDECGYSGPAFRQKLSDGWYQVRIAGRDVSTSGLTAQLHETLPDGAVIHIVPRVAGAKSGGVFQIVLGAAAIAGSFFTAGATLAAWGAAIGAGGMTGILFSLGASMVLGGVAQMLAPKARTPRTQTTDNGKQNTYFSSLDNMVAQGNVLPVLYGEMRVGSRVVSQEISTADEGDGGQVVVIGR